MTDTPTGTRSRRKLAIIVGLSLAVLIAGGVLLRSWLHDGTSNDAKPIRVGWQIAWATQGQIAMALQKTNALELTGIKGDFKSFTYGAPLSEAALAGQLDVAFVGDQPAISLLSRSPDWRIVARLMDFRVAIVVPPDSPVKTVDDLKGKTLGIPFGASTHRVALQMLKEAGLDPAKDLTILNIDIQEQADIVKAGAGKAWPKVDAFASWDHFIGLYEKQEYARILKSGTALGVVMMSQKFIESRPKDAAAFLAAYKLAYLYYATNQAQVDGWFADAAGGKFEPAILISVAAIEPNMRARALSDLNIDIAPRHITILQEACDFARTQDLIKGNVSVTDRVIQGPAREADKLLASTEVGTLKASR